MEKMIKGFSAEWKSLCSELFAVYYLKWALQEYLNKNTPTAAEKKIIKESLSKVSDRLDILTLPIAKTYRSFNATGNISEFILLLESMGLQFSCSERFEKYVCSCLKSSKVKKCSLGEYKLTCLQMILHITFTRCTWTKKKI